MTLPPYNRGELLQQQQHQQLSPVSYPPDFPLGFHPSSDAPSMDFRVQGRPDRPTNAINDLERRNNTVRSSQARSSHSYGQSVNLGSSSGMLHPEADQFAHQHGKSFNL